MSQIQLVAPTSSPARIKQLAAASPKLLYAVTIAGVTGSRQSVASETLAYLTKVKSQAKGLVVAGFGVSSPELAVKLAAPVDGVVVGSAMVEITRGTSNFESALVQVGSFLGGIRTALDKDASEISRS
jgi:tryptophan synthase alpha chain